MILAKFHHVELPPPPNLTFTHTDRYPHIQTDSDCTKRVVTTLRNHTLKNACIRYLNRKGLNPQIYAGGFQKALGPELFSIAFVIVCLKKTPDRNVTSLTILQRPMSAATTAAPRHVQCMPTRKSNHTRARTHARTCQILFVSPVVVRLQEQCVSVCV